MSAAAGRVYYGVNAGGDGCKLLTLDPQPIDARWRRLRALGTFVLSSNSGIARTAH